MTVLILLAYILSLSSPDEYVLARPSVSNALFRGVGSAVFPRIEDVAFLQEAYLERYSYYDYGSNVKGEMTNSLARNQAVIDCFRENASISTNGSISIYKPVWDSSRDSVMFQFSSKRYSSFSFFSGVSNTFAFTPIISMVPADSGHTVGGLSKIDIVSSNAFLSGSIFPSNALYMTKDVTLGIPILSSNRIARLYEHLSHFDHLVAESYSSSTYGDSVKANALDSYKETIIDGVRTYSTTSHRYPSYNDWGNTEGIESYNSSASTTYSDSISSRGNFSSSVFPASAIVESKSVQTRRDYDLITTMRDNRSGASVTYRADVVDLGSYANERSTIKYTGTSSGTPGSMYFSSPFTTNLQSTVVLEAAIVLFNITRHEIYQESYQDPDVRNVSSNVYRRAVLALPVSPYLDTGKVSYVYGKPYYSYYLTIPRSYIHDESIRLWGSIDNLYLNEYHYGSDSLPSTVSSGHASLVRQYSATSSINLNIEPHLYIKFRVNYRTTARKE